MNKIDPSVASPVYEKKSEENLSPKRVLFSETMLNSYKSENQAISENKLSAQKSSHIEHLNHYLESQKYILECAKGLKGEALILGFGAGHDIPLEKLADQFDKITICEIEMSFTEKRLQGLSENLKGKIIVRHCDLTGILEPLSKFVETAAKTMHYREFILKTCEFLTNSEFKAVEVSKDKFSYIISSLLTSQLASGIMIYLTDIFCSTYKINVKMAYDAINRTLTHLNLESKHLANISNWMTPGGKIYFSDSFIERRTILDSSGEKVQNGPDYPLFVKGFVEEISKKFNVEKKEEWVWVRFSPKMPSKYIRPGEGAEMVIKAYFLSHK